MFCIKCGVENSDEAVYCQKCGDQFPGADEEETRVVKKRVGFDDEDSEREIFSIRPTLMFVKIGYGLAVIGAFFLVALLSFFSQLTGIVISPFISVTAGLLLLLIPAYFHIRQKMILYTLTDSKVEIDMGLLSKTTRNVPLRIIQDVTVTANFAQRVLGFGNIEIENANENDSRIVLKNINSPKRAAASMLEQMHKLNK